MRSMQNTQEPKARPKQAKKLESPLFKNLTELYQIETEEQGLSTKNLTRLSKTILSIDYAKRHAFSHRSLLGTGIVTTSHTWMLQEGA